MDRNLSRGALLVLPFLFWGTVTAAAKATPADLYRFFFLPLPETAAWLAKDKGDPVKDLFLARYHVPLKGRGTVTAVPVEPQKRYGGAGEYFHLYLESAQKSSFVWTLSGIAKGSLSINGEKKGAIALSSPAEYARLEVTLAPGVYALLFTIEERQAGLPLTLLSDKPITFSTRGFTKSFTSTVKITSRSMPDGEQLARLYRSSCIPAPQDDERGRAAWAAAFGPAAAPSVYDQKQPLIVLLRNADEEKTRAALGKAGFDEASLAWWKELFAKGGFCADEP